jgi:sugar lactone lactonase YvrE
MRTLLLWCSACVLAIAAYLLAWPIPVQPVGFSPAATPALAGPYAANERLATVQRLAEGVGRGPEDVAFDAQGRLFAGYQDGRLVGFAADGKDARPLASTGGRPLGLRLDPEGRLIVADAERGLLAVTREGGVSVLTAGHGAEPFRLTDDLDIARDGTIVFSDASSRFGVGDSLAAVLDRPSGRLLAYQPSTGTTRLLLDGLAFANGVALSPDEASVMVVETGAYRVRRLWLTGPRAGQSDLLIDNLPGFPDGITRGEAGVYWIALFAPRNALLDAAHPRPWLKRALFRLPELVRPKPERHAFVLGVDEAGRVVANLQATGPARFAPVTNVVEHDGWLYLGSLEQDAIGRVRRP